MHSGIRIMFGVEGNVLPGVFWEMGGSRKGAGERNKERVNDWREYRRTTRFVVSGGNPYNIVVDYNKEQWATAHSPRLVQ